MEAHTTNTPKVDQMRFRFCLVGKPHFVIYTLHLDPISSNPNCGNVEMWKAHRQLNGPIHLVEGTLEVNELLMH